MEAKADGLVACMGVLVPKFVPSRLHPHPAKPSFNFFPFGICGTLASSASIAPQIPREVFMIYEFSSHEAMIQAWAEDPGLPGPSPWWCRFYAQNNSPRRLPSRQTGFLGHDSAQRTPVGLACCSTSLMPVLNVTSSTKVNRVHVLISATLNPCGRSYPQECLA